MHKHKVAINYFASKSKSSHPIQRGRHFFFRPFFPSDAKELWSLPARYYLPSYFLKGYNHDRNLQQSNCTSFYFFSLNRAQYTYESLFWDLPVSNTSTLQWPATHHFVANPLIKVTSKLIPHPKFTRTVLWQIASVQSSFLSFFLFNAKLVTSLSPA